MKAIEKPDFVMYQADAIWINSKLMYSIISQYPKECTIISTAAEIIIIQIENLLDVIEDHVVSSEKELRMLTTMFEMLSTWASYINVIITTKEV